MNSRRRLHKWEVTRWEVTQWAFKCNEYKYS
ncbi:hypothetical protein LINPERPRIM_LOCUS41221 [Linum perenne]